MASQSPTSTLKHGTPVPGEPQPRSACRVLTSTAWASAKNRLTLAIRQK